MERMGKLFGEETMKKGAMPLACAFYVLTAYALTGIMLLGLAFLLYRFQMSSKLVGIGVIVIYLAATFLAGFLAGKRAKSRKFAWGACMGVIYFMILAGVSLLTGAGDAASTLLPSFLLCLAGGTFGGMLS